jgi:putative hemolysin
MSNPLDIQITDLKIPAWAKLVLCPIEPILFKWLGVTQLRIMYDELEARESSSAAIKEILHKLNITYSIYPNHLDRIPSSGPLVIVSNHPFGGLEALLLVQILRAVRTDVKFLANFLLGRISELSDIFILVDPFENEQARRKNIAPLREALKWLRQGGTLIVFPSGTVSHLHVTKGEVRDPKWNSSVATLIRKTEATVIPFFIHGRNSWFFQLAGLINPLFRTALLPRQLLNKANCHVTVQLGKPIAYSRLSKFTSDEDVISYLRVRTYIQKNSKLAKLGKRFTEPSLSITKNINKIVRKTTHNKLIAEAEDAQVISGEIEALPEDQVLLKSGVYLIGFATASQIPVMLREIGRLREEAFRIVGEGTGNERDLDWFDNYYHHLFCWNSEKKELVGAYRIGCTDEIVKRYGIKGLYTYTLFHYKSHLLDQLGPALEMGRSFVRPKYQKNYLSLLLLWKGIGRYVVNNPKYKVLFGPVSISDDYDSVSRKLMETFLMANNFEEALAQLVKPRSPSPKQSVLGVDAESMTRVVRDLGEVSELIADVELREQAVPVLLREYVKLGGKLIGFNVDPNFSGVVDGLIVVDLTQTKRNLLDRYLGKPGAESFLKFHESSAVSSQVQR